MLDKYFVLEPWVQAIILIALTMIIVSLLYFLKEIIIQSIDSLNRSCVAYKVANNVVKSASKNSRIKK